MVRSLKFLIIAWFSLAQMLVGTHSAIAQSESAVGWVPNNSGFQYVQFQSDSLTPIDVDPPLIEHEVTAQAEADIRQTFVATVVDDGELDSVIFFYRFAGETNFTRYVMAPLSASSTYTAQIPTEPKNYTAIEYYIQARDLSGNRTVRGYTFSPLVREILPASKAGATGPQATVGGVVVGDKNSTSGISKILYVVGGVLVLGILAGVSSSGGDGGSSSCPSGLCTVPFTIQTPPLN